MNKEKFYTELSKLGIELSEKQKGDLENFAHLLLEYNKHTNITAIRDTHGVYLKHFYDSLTLAKVYDFNKNIDLLDVGSGGGFPGIVLAIVYPNLKVTLLDSNHKKSDFQNYIVDKLKLNNVLVVNDRAENYYKKEIQYDLVVARAVANLSVLSELCIPFVKNDGYFISMKGDSALEIKEAKGAIEFLGGNLENICTFYLQNGEDIRNLVVIKKEKDTPSGYPRIFDKIVKKPIK